MNVPHSKTDVFRVFGQKKVNEFNENWVAKISVEISVKIKCLFYRSNSFGCDVSK